MAEQFITDDNLLKKETYISPSGKYLLEIGTYKTLDGCWSYTSGKLIQCDQKKEIAVIHRNYSIMYHSFFMKDGQEWLQTGTNYMSQIFVNCDTGEIYNNEDSIKQTEQYQKGNSFCWTRSQINPTGTIILVEGCYWGGPYQYKFFDVTDISQGWPELVIDEFCYSSEWVDNIIWDDTTCEIHIQQEFYKKDGNLINTSTEEYDALSDQITDDEYDMNHMCLDKEVLTYQRDGGCMKLLERSPCEHIIC